MPEVDGVRYRSPEPPFQDHRYRDLPDDMDILLRMKKRLEEELEPLKVVKANKERAHKAAATQYSKASEAVRNVEYDINMIKVAMNHQLKVPREFAREAGILIEEGTPIKS